MTLHSPLLEAHLARGASMLEYPNPTEGGAAAGIVGAFGPVELEYAAVRRGCALFDLPQRATILVRGSERLDLLIRMLTQQVKDMTPWQVRHSFWLNRKGRIDADLRVTALDDHIRFDLDAHAASRTVQTLSSYLFAEDVELLDAGASLHRLALHGPGAAALIAGASEHVDGPEPSRLGDRQACRVRIGGREVLVERDDLTGEIGLHLTCETGHAREVWDALLRAGAPEEADATHAALAERVRLRPAGWHALNVARIEAGSPLYLIDFGADSLPHETGVLHDRVSFKKGCYLGQEVVARMESLGHPKQRLVALRFADEKDHEAPQPISGGQVFAPAQAEKALGIVTSSTLSPMLGSVPVCFAMVRFEQSHPGTELLVEAEGTRRGARVQDGLVFWKRAGLG